MSTSASISAGMAPARRALARFGFSFTAAAAGFCFSFRAALVMITVRWLNAGTQPGVAAAFVIEALLLLAVALHSMGRAAIPLSEILRVPSVRWVGMFLAFSCCSLAWSGTVSKPASFLYWCGMAADVTIVLSLLRAQPAEEVCHSMITGYVGSICALAAMAWMMPATSDFRLGDEDYFNTNQIANLCALGIFMAQYVRSGARRSVVKENGPALPEKTATPRGQGTGIWWGPAMLLLTITLLRSVSKATLGAFAVSQGVLLLRNQSITRTKKAFIAGAAVLAVIASWGFFMAYYSVYTTSGNRSETLTGRTGIWLYALTAGLEKPWTGNGMDAMWKVAPPMGNELFEPRHAENELLQQFYAYGLAGVALLFGAYGSLWRGIRRGTVGTTRAVLLSLMLFIFIRGLAEAEPFDLLLPLWMIVLVGVMAKPREGSECA